MRRWIWLPVLTLFVHAYALAAPQTRPAVEAQDPPEPEHAIDFEVDRPWAWTGYRDVNTTADRYPFYEVRGGVPRFGVSDARTLRVWSYLPHLPISVEHYPIAVMRYRSHRAWGAWYNLWIGGTRAPDNPSAALTTSLQLAPDGREHEVRIDMRKVEFNAPQIQTILIGSHATNEPPGVFELVALRFESEEGTRPAKFEDEAATRVEVVDEAGEPVADAAVILDAERRNFARRGTTDASGVAEIKPLGNESGRHMVRVEAEGYFTTEQGSFAAGEAVQVRLQPAARYSGRVLDANGNPLASAVVALVQMKAATDRVRDQVQRVSTGEDGRFLTEPMAIDPRQIAVTVTHPDCFPLQEQVQAQTPRMVELRQGRAEFRLERGVSITGRVIASQPTLYGYYLLTSGGGANPVAGCDSEGRFTMRGLKPGVEYTIRVTHNNQSMGEATVVAEEGAKVEITARD